MSIVFEVLIYLVLVFGIMITTIAFCENSLSNKERYIRVKKEGTSIKLVLETEGINDKDKELIKNIIVKGMFQNIYDIVDEYQVN